MVTAYHQVAYLSTNVAHMATTSFGRYLKTLLDRRHWSQTDLANRIGVSKGTVSRWITDERVPDTTSCDLLADAFLVPIDDVLIAAGHRPPDARFAPDDPRSAVAALARRVTWTPERQGAIEALMRQWIDYDRTRKD